MNKFHKYGKIFPAIVVLVMLINLALPFTVHAQDATPTETPAAPAEEPTAIPIDTVAESTPVIEPTPVTEVILTEAPQGTEVVVVNDTGESLPIDSIDAAQVISAIDPMWCPDGALPNDPGCSAGMSTTELLADMRANPDKYAANGVIYFDNSASFTDAFVVDDSSASLGDSYNSLNSFNLNLFGGWDGGASNTFNGQTIFNSPNAFIAIGNLSNPWLGSVAMNNFRILGNQDNTSGIEINASNVDLINVESSNNAGNGIIINASAPGTVDLQDVIAANNGAGNPDSTSSGIVINGNNTALNVDGGSFNNNAGYGIEASQSNSTSIPKGNSWTDLTEYSPGSVVTLSGNDNLLNGETLGFIPGENVHVDVSGPNRYSAECDSVADSTGKWTCQVTLWSSDLAIGDYTFSANGITSGIRVDGGFSDGRLLNWAKVDGGTSVTVAPGASITATMNVTTSGSGSGLRWESSQWSIAPNGFGTYYCSDTSDFTVAGTHETSFTITAPAAVGTYNAYFYAWSGQSCNSGNSNRFDLFSAVIVVAKSDQAPLVVAATPSTVIYGNTSTLSTTGGSGTGAVTYSSGVSTGCSLAGDVLSVTNASGTCTVTATKAGDATYNPVTSAPLTVTLQKANQAALTSIATPSTVTYGNTSTLSSSGGSGTGAVNFDAGASTGCSVAGTTLSVTNASGTCSITATKAADNDYNSATSAAITVTLQKANQATLNAVATPSTVTYGNTSTLSSTGGSGTGAVTFDAGGSTGCSISGGTTLNVTNASGSCSITATKAADANYNSANSAALPVALQKATPVITFDAAPAPTYPGSDFSVNATTTNTDSSSLTYSAVSGPCTFVSSSTFSSTGSGDCVVQAAGAATANFNIASNTQIVTISGKTTPTITWSNPADITYPTALSAAQLNATASVPGTFTYTPAAGAILDAGSSQTLHVDFTPDDTTNYNNASKDVSINVLKADATCTISGYSGTYDGASHGATGSCSGTGTLDLGASFTDYPGGTANWTYSGGTNYYDQGSPVAIDISKADATCAVTPYSVTYDASSHTATGSCTGVGGPGDILTGLDLSGTTHTNANTYGDSWSFTDVTGNYNDTGDTISDFIDQAGCTCLINGYTGTYDGASHSATGSCTGIGGADLSGGLSLGDMFTNANSPGDITFWYFSDVSGNYKDQDGSVIIEIFLADANCTVTPYSVTYDDNPHTATGTCTGIGGPTDILGGLDLSGTTHTDAGTYPDTWYFNDAAGNYNSIEDFVDDAIDPADATCTVTPYSVAYDGSAHTATGSCTGVGGGGDFLSGLDLSGTTHTDADSYTDNWTFTDVTGNYYDAGDSITDDISKADASCTIDGFSGTYDGTAHGAEGFCTGIGGVDLSGNLDLGSSFTDFPGGMADWTFTGGTNYNNQGSSVAIDINQAVSMVTVTCPLAPQTYTGAAQTPCTAEATGAGMTPLDVSPSLLYADNINVGTATVSASWGGDANHTGNTGSGSFTISPAAGSVSINNLPVNPEFGGSFTPTFDLLGDGTPSVATLTPGICTVTLGVVDFAGVGICTLQASITAGSNYLAAAGAPQSFNVVDTTAPVLTLPANITVIAGGSAGAVVLFTASAYDLVDGSVPVTCNPSSGTPFFIGITPVNCSASDANENTSSGSFTITVLPRGTSLPPTPPPQLITFIPVNADQLTNLACDSLSSLLTRNGLKAEFLSVLCGYQVSFNEERAEILPETIPGTFHHGVTLQILANNSPLDLVPENALVRISFPVPQGSEAEDYNLLFWNNALNSGAGGWMELPLVPGMLNPDNPLDARRVITGLQIVDGFAQFTVNFPGTFIIVLR